MRELARHEVQARFATLAPADRRAVLRSVNRGRAAPERALAPVALGVARRQRRFWRLAWLMGPAIGSVQFFLVPTPQAVANLVAGTAALGGMAVWWHGRARRAEAANLALMGGGSAGDRASGRRAPLPGRTPSAGASADPTSGVERPSEALPARPPRPRGRKRR